MKNKNKNQIKKRIGALLCALIVAVSAFGMSTPYYAFNSGTFTCSADSSVDTEYVDSVAGFKYAKEYSFGGTLSYEDTDVFRNGIACSNSPIVSYIAIYINPDDGYIMAMLYFLSLEPISICRLPNDYTSHISSMRFRTSTGVYFYCCGVSMFQSFLSPSFNFYGADFVVNVDKAPNGLYKHMHYAFPIELLSTGVDSGPKYDSSLGYLQNVQRKSTYIRGALYNYDVESLTQHWYHGLSTTSGVDLTSGAYKIRHYISNATVTGYEKDDIVEMSDKYLVGEYDASKGYFSYLQKDYDDKLVEQGYKELGFIDTVFKGYFTLQHHYFQIVNTSTNEVGGYLHFYPKDAKGDNFWTDYVDLGYEGMDNDFVVDEEGPSGTIENIVGSGETVEDALENADSPKLGDLSGVDEVASNLEAYASQISNVTSGIGALLAEFPAWIVGLLGLSVALIFVVIVVKSLRG